MNKLKLTAALVSTTALMSLISAQAEVREFDLDGFTKVKSSAGVDVEVMVGGDFSVRVDTDDRGFDRVKISVEGDTLKISRKSKFGFSGRRGPDISARVTLPSLEAIGASSGSRLDASNVEASNFSINASSGAEVKVSGACGTLNANVSSGADIDGKDLECSNADVSASSGADATVYASDSVDANASSGASIRVFGGASERNIGKSTGGSVTVRD